MEALAGPQPDPTFMWHGSFRQNILTICNEGFDHRVANMGGALGVGVYFAECKCRESITSCALLVCAPPPPPFVLAMWYHFGVLLQVLYRSWLAMFFLILTPRCCPHFAGAGYSIQYSARPATVNPGLIPMTAWMAQQGFLGLPAVPVAAPQPTKKTKKKSTRVHSASVSSGGPAVTVEDWPGTFSMLLCNVVVGRCTAGGAGMRKPPAGFDSVFGQGASGTKNYAVFDNAQAYPTYLVHFT